MRSRERGSPESMSLAGITSDSNLGSEGEVGTAFRLIRVANSTIKTTRPPAILRCFGMESHVPT